MSYQAFKTILQELLTSLRYSNQSLNLNEQQLTPVYLAYYEYGRATAVLQFSVFPNLVLEQNTVIPTIAHSHSFTFYPAFFHSFISEDAEIDFEVIKDYLIQFLFNEFKLERFCIRWDESNYRVRPTFVYLNEDSEELFSQVNRVFFHYHDFKEKLPKQYTPISSLFDPMKCEIHTPPMQWYPHPNFALAHNETHELFRIMEKQDVLFVEKTDDGYRCVPTTDVLIERNATQVLPPELKTRFESLSNIPEYFETMVYYALVLHAQPDLKSNYNIKTNFIYEISNF